MAKKSELQLKREENRLRAEADLEFFINLVHPKRLLGAVHKEVISWWMASNASNHQLLLLPRDHMKSALVVYRVAWEITRDPTLRVLLISSTSNLATKQLKFIKDILTSDTYRLYWPEMVNKEDVKREKWTEREISVDHPRRREENVRDPTVFTAGLTTNITGLHCDICVLDDVVVAGNAYTEEGRGKVKDQYSLLSSVEGAGAREWVVGTRYHPLDLYADLIQMEMEQYDANGLLVSKKQLFDVFERAVETVGDGTGEFLWPKQQRSDGKWFGFDAQVLGEKRLKYINQTHFRAQYYNDPHDVGSSPINRDLFQYYDANYLGNRDGRWFFKGERLNVVASVDFAYSLGKRADYTAIVVLGVDGRNNYYILEIDRFKADRPSDYYQRILKLYGKWGFNKIRAEVSVAQKVIVNDLKENYIRPAGLALTVDEYRPSRWQGSKDERILAVLEPRYSNRQIWHYRGGNCQVLEEELIYTNPAHDDCKDALASAVDFAVPPLNIFAMKKTELPTTQYHSRFGGTL